MDDQWEKLSARLVHHALEAGSVDRSYGLER